MSFPQYPKYKASGVEWLGEVPAHWRVVRLQHVSTSRCDGPFGSGLKSEHYTEDGVRVVRLQNIKVDGFDGSDAAYVSPDYVAQQLAGHDVVSGDLLVAGLGDDNNLVGRACVAPPAIGPAIVKADCFRFRIDERECRPQFAAFSLNASVIVDSGRMATGSTRSRIPLSVMASRSLALPPLGEQDQVIAFLDRETAKIDALVAEQQRLIELLKEKRQAVISHAVTKGLDRNAKMKQSGIEWLGDVPAHWELHRIGRLFQEASDPGSDDLPVLSVSIHDGVSDDELGDDDLERKVTRSEDRTKYKRVRPRDLVYNMMRAWQGGFGTVAVDGMVSPAYVVARPRDGVPTWLVEQQLRTPTAVQEMRRHSRGVTDFRLRLYWEEFKTMVVPLPPDREVAAIEGFLQREEEAAASLVAEAERAITLLQERRTALISAAVTGQVDVRSATSQPWS